MIHVDTVQVLSESDPRMQQSNLFSLSHREGGFSYYSINVNESDNKDMQYIEESLTRQGIPANIYPDRLKDNVIAIRFTNKGELSTGRYQYSWLLTMPTDNTPIEYPEFCKFHLDVWDNQIRNGNVYSLSQFMKPDKDE